MIKVFVFSLMLTRYLWLGVVVFGGFGLLGGWGCGVGVEVGLGLVCGCGVGWGDGWGDEVGDEGAVVVVLVLIVVCMTIARLVFIYRKNSGGVVGVVLFAYG